MSNNGQTLRQYLETNPGARISVKWLNRKQEVWTTFQVTAVFPKCFFGNALSGEPSRGKPYWSVLDWKPA